MKHRVLFVTQEYTEHNAGGAGVFARELTMALAQAGTVVHVMAPGAANSTVTLHKNLTIHYVKVIDKPLLHVPSLHWQIFRQARPIIKAQNINVIHSNNLAGITVMRLRPAVATIHHPIRSELRLSTLKQLFIMLPDAVLEVFMIRFARKISTPSHMVADLVAQMDKQAQAKTIVICNGVGPDFLRKVSGSALRKRLLPANRDVLLFFPGGGRAKRKGGLALLQALAKLDRKVKYHCIVSGQSREAGWEGELQAAIKKFKLSKKISFVGELSYTDLPKYYAAADITVYPSTFEGFGLPIVETMAVGTPIITTDTGEAPYIISQQSGMIITVNDADALATSIQTLTDNAALRRRMGKAGQQRIQDTYTWPLAAKAFVTLYRNALKEKL